MSAFFRKKRILITAGPTWVAIDPVRVISNRASGSTGIALAERLAGFGASVILFLGPVSFVNRRNRFVLRRFQYFDELRRMVKGILREKSFDIIIHSAAVSDFKPLRVKKNKLPSGKKAMLALTPLPKIIADIGRLKKKAKLVMFKLEPGVSDRKLYAAAFAGLKKANADLVVANRTDPYNAFIIDGEGTILTKKLLLKKNLIGALIKTLYKQGV